MTRPPYYPLFLDLSGRGVVIVGGGAVSARKVESMLHHGASVTVVAPALSAEIETWAREQKLEVRRRLYEPADLDGAAIVIASTNDAAVNARVAADAKARGALVNVADAPALCDFIVPAVVESGPIQIAVSTGGSSPALARRLRIDLQALLGSEYAELGEILGSLRDAAKTSTSLPADADRRQFFDAVIQSDALSLLRQGRRRDAYALVARLCATAGVPLSDLVRREIETA